MADPGKIDALSLSEIMRVWPATIHIFIDWHLHCIGCPIADFHLLADSADEHLYDREALRTAVLLAIDADVSTSAPPRGRKHPTGRAGRSQ